MDSKVLVSIVIRTLNEGRHLGELLNAIEAQEVPANWSVEVVIVDSGSTDDTLAIAQEYECRVTHISRDAFTFGRSLNLGCDCARGDFLVFVSGHCVPVARLWLERLVEPLVQDQVQYAYGRQIGRDTTKFSETRVFEKYYPTRSLIPQEGFFTNNANAAVTRKVFKELRFDETLTGLEDMHFARRLIDAGGMVGYIADAEVFHIHDESWIQVRNRYEREAVALCEIVPESRFGLRNFVSSLVRSVIKDSYRALQKGLFTSEITEIVLFRFNQFLGSYNGMRLAQSLARIHSKDYFYPDRIYTKNQKRLDEEDSYSPSTHEGSQQQGTRKELQIDTR